jgi:hypothetical protein
MTTTTIDTARYIELNHLFNSKDRLYLYGLLNKLGSGYDAGLACLDAVLQHRVYTMSTIARTANLQGFNMNAAGATIQLGRITKALARCRVYIWVDGILEDEDFLRRLPLENIAAVELFNSDAFAPARFRTFGDTCNTLLVWTKAFLNR